jgi:hypothetical protein
VGAGASAGREALRARLNIVEFERRLAFEQQQLRNYTAASESERRIAGMLAAMAAWDWTLLADRRWPGTRNANVDLLHVGPGGLFVIDVKAWAEPRIADGILWRGDAEATHEVEKLLAVTALVDEVAEAQGLAPIAVVPLVVLAGAHRMVAPLGRAYVVGEADLLPWLHRRGSRIDPEQVPILVKALAEAFPPHDEPEPDAPVVHAPEIALPRPAEPEQIPLLDLDELEATLLDPELAKPIESWMTFLHPSQVRLVRRSWNGPARLRGPAGTGKSAVGLHRAAYLAATRPGRILVTSFVRTVPDVLRALYERLSPDTVDRVEFTNVHRWAKRLLDERHVRYELDPPAAAAALRRAWARAGEPLAGIAPFEYWRDEIGCVLKGRGITEYADYANLARVGRRTALGADVRAAVWDLYSAYDDELRSVGVCDFDDVLIRALSEVRREPIDPPYTAVVVDEVQDLTKIGLQLVHALVGDEPDGLLLIGDGQQAIYPGGVTLAEAGVSVAGRAHVLSINYRNAAEILDAAAAFVADDTFDDLDGQPEDGRRDVTVIRSGGHTTVCEQPDVHAHDAALAAAIRGARGECSFGDMAVLAPARYLVRHYEDLLRQHGIPVELLTDYAGRTTDAVKVGTFKRAKGLEFKVVFLPRFHDRAPSAATQDAVALDRRERYVAMTRARDVLWIGQVR